MTATEFMTRTGTNIGGGASTTIYSDVVSEQFTAAVLALMPTCSGSVMARVVCDPGGFLLGLVEDAARHWPAVLAALTGAAAILATARVLWARTRASALARRARRADWWEITPPAVLAPGAAIAGWQVLHAALARTPRRPHLAGPPVIVAEISATATDGLRMGVWIAPPVNGDRVAAGLAHAWPGARITRTRPPQPDTDPPDLATTAGDTTTRRRPAQSVSALTVAARSVAARSVAAAELVPVGGPWAPLIAPARRRVTGPPPAPRTVGGDAGRGRPDPLRAVFGALADRAPEDHALVQLVLTRPGPAGNSILRAVIGATIGGVLRGLAELVTVLMPGPIQRRNRPRHTARTTAGHPAPSGDPAEMARAARIAAVADKRAGGPHLRVTLRATVAHRRGATPADARAAGRRLIADVTDGYALVVDPITAFRVRRITRTSDRRVFVSGRGSGAARVADRAPGRAFMATLAELAALWHLPADPIRHGLTAPPARTRAATRGLPRAHPAVPDRGQRSSTRWPNPTRPAPTHPAPRHPAPRHPGPGPIGRAGRS